MQKNLPDLLRQPEGEQLDFKQRISSPEKIAKTICAFANTRGGILLVGIKDDHSITGVDPEEEKFILDQAAQDYCEPPIPLEYEEFEDPEGRVVLHVSILESEAKPHSCRNRLGVWQVYVRQRDKSVPAGAQIIKNLKKGLAPTVMPEIQYTKYEYGVLQFIAVHQRINVKQLMILLNFSKRSAERLLFEMTEKGLIRCYEHEQDAFYA